MERKDTDGSSLTKSWPTLLNRFFIGVGVLALVVFVIGKAFQEFRIYDDTFEAVSIDDSESLKGGEKKLILLSKDSSLFDDGQNFSDLESVFGSKVVFVSATDPAYVMTNDMRRYEVGGFPRSDIELSSISSTKLVLKRHEELMVFALP